jgi:hypothetical protein
VQQVGNITKELYEEKTKNNSKSLENNNVGFK